MGSPPILPFALTDTTPPLTSYEKRIECSSSPGPGSLVASPFESLYVLNATSPVYGWQQSDVQFPPGSGLAQPCLYPGQDETTSPPLPFDHFPGQGQDASHLSLSSMVMGTHCLASPHDFNGFTGTFAHAGVPARAAQAVQVIPGLGLGLPNSTRYHHPSPGTINVGIQHSFQWLDQPTCIISNVSASASSPSSTEDATNSAITIYRSPQKKGPGRRRCQRACAIKIEGMWIDKEDLHSGPSNDNSMISVHECRWAQSSNSCGMWIIGSKPHVGAHILKWHQQEHADGTVKRRCLWDGCTTSKEMRKDSVSRHIINVHLEEEFHCQGCDKGFPRRDVYDNHVQNNEVCRDAGAAIVYGAEHEVINARQALQQKVAPVRYAV
ncbi:hypothetical protein HD554DRAFT_2035632 [Boletus coccyginus]|nr:hypothetical protein HD554DRAFT_2035632 [Boletus coccyginus]